MSTAKAPAAPSGRICEKQVLEGCWTEMIPINLQHEQALYIYIYIYMLQFVCVGRGAAAGAGAAIRAVEAGAQCAGVSTSLKSILTLY